MSKGTGIGCRQSAGLEIFQCGLGARSTFDGFLRVDERPFSAAVSTVPLTPTQLPAVSHNGDILDQSFHR